MAKIYHYTSIETLALILKNKTIRFNRLDNNLDDLEEGQISSNGVKLGNYGFVSCWTEEKNESIPLWKLYTSNGIGVRIALEQDMFKDYVYSGVLEIGDIRFDTDKSGYNRTKTPIEDMFNSEYIVFTLLSDQYKSPTFYKTVEYVDDMRDRLKDCVKILPKDKNGHQIITICHNDIGLYKKKHWEFEKETRFFLFIIPGKKLKMHKDFNNDWNQWLYDIWTKNIKNTITDYYMHLKDDIFDDMEIVLSPNCSESNRIIVESLCKQYAPNAKIFDSSLKNLVKLK